MLARRASITFYLAAATIITGLLRFWAVASHSDSDRGRDVMMMETVSSSKMLSNGWLHDHAGGADDVTLVRLCEILALAEVGTCVNPRFTYTAQVARD